MDELQSWSDLVVKFRWLVYMVLDLAHNGQFLLFTCFVRIALEGWWISWISFHSNFCENCDNWLCQFVVDISYVGWFYKFCGNSILSLDWWMDMVDDLYDLWVSWQWKGMEPYFWKYLVGAQWRLVWETNFKDRDRFADAERMVGCSICWMILETYWLEAIIYLRNLSLGI